MSGATPQVAVVQDGARLHYAIPLALQRAGALERVFVEWYAKPGAFTSMVVKVAKRLRPEVAERMRQRVHPEIDASRVITNARLAYEEAKARRGFDAPEEFYAWASDKVGAWVARKGFGRADGIFGFVRNISPDLCVRARERGLTVVADQMIAPMVEERRQAKMQAQRFPEWSKTAQPCNEDVVEEVERRTWAATDQLTCGSDYVRDTLIAAGVDGEKITVLPYPIEAQRHPYIDRRFRRGPLVVGAVGAVGLRKGTPYFLKVAERLPSVQFRLVGPVTVDSKLLEGRPNVTVVGPVPRNGVIGQLASFDVLLFPSTCEGSPGAVMEAMASGLPIVTSPTAGTVVRHEKEGFVHAYDDIDALAASLDRLASDKQLRREMSWAARQRVESFDVDGYGRGLVEVFGRGRATAAS